MLSLLLLLSLWFCKFSRSHLQPISTVHFLFWWSTSFRPISPFSHRHYRFLRVKVLTFVGLPLTPCAFDLFLATALFFSAAVIRLAVAFGTHFGYPARLVDAFFLPHLGCEPSFFFAPIFTHSSRNHFFSPLRRLFATISASTSLILCYYPCRTIC